MPPTILLLDDDTQFRSSVIPALEAFGLRVLSATKGSIARAQLEEEEPSMLIVDGLLPDVNGIEWIEALRADGNQTPIIFVSAFYRDLNTFKHLTHNLGVLKVFHKPVAVDRFAREVASAVSVPMSAAPKLEEPEPGVLYPEESSEPGVDPEKARSSYVSLLPIAADNLTGAIRKVHAETERSSVVADALRQAHELHGAAETHGLDEISQAAGRIEAELLPGPDVDDDDGAPKPRPRKAPRPTIPRQERLRPMVSSPSPAPSPPAPRPPTASSTPIRWSASAGSRSCAASTGRSARAGRSRRGRRWTRSSWPAPPSGMRRCTTSTNCTARTCALATR